MTISSSCISIIQQGLSGSTPLRRSGLTVAKETGKKEEETNINQSSKRMLAAGTKRLLQINVSIDFDCDDDEEDNIDDELSLIPSPTTSPIPMPTFNGIFSGSPFDWIGNAYSISDDLVIIGLFREGDYAADNTGAAYLFNLDGSNVKGFTPVDGDINDQYGNSVSIDEKIVVGTGPYGVQYVEVFSREGIYERKLTCDDCSEFGTSVATLGYKIVMNGEQDLVSNIFIYTI